MGMGMAGGEGGVDGVWAWVRLGVRVGLMGCGHGYGWG